MAFGVMVAAAGAVWLVKAGVGRLAPSSGSDQIRAGGRSYPSGHAVAAVVCWGLLLEHAGGLGRRRRHALTALLAGAAGLGMAALDSHWLSDVLAGWLLGAIVLGVALQAQRTEAGVTVSRPLHRAAPREPAQPAPSG